MKEGHPFFFLFFTPDDKRTLSGWIFIGCPLPGLGTVQWSGDQVSPAVSVEDQGLATRQHPTSKADLGPTERGEAVVGGEAWAGETFRQERWECLGGELTGRTAEARVTPDRRRRDQQMFVSLGLNKTLILTCSLYGNNVLSQSRNEGRRDQCRLKQTVGIKIGFSLCRWMMFECTVSVLVF